MTHSLRRGFTLIELLVVIAIIAILVALLLPAVQQVREAARKSQCQDHLHNIAIATSSYEGTYMTLPPGSFFSITSNGQTSQRGGTLVHLLPYVEQKPLFDMLDFRNLLIVENSVFPGTANLIRENNPVEVFVCPSDTSGDMFPPTTGAVSRGAQNYIASQGSSTVGHTNTGNTAGSPPCVSPFSATALGGAGEVNGTSGCFRRGLPGHCTIAEIVDGTSNVIWFGEARPDCSNHVAQGWLHTNNGQGMGSTTIPINYDSCSYDTTSQCRWRGNWNTEFGFRSRHAGGAQFAFGDGVVRFISENIDHTSYQYLGGKADGNPVKLP